MLYIKSSLFFTLGLLVGCSAGTIDTGSSEGAAGARLEGDHPTWTKCADENGYCTVSGTATVRYGAGTTFVTQAVTGGVACSNSTFGDPDYGVYKHCDIASTTSALSSGAVVTIAASSGACLTDLDASSQNGAQQVFQTCSGDKSQQYQVTINGDGSATLVDVASQLCIDVPWASTVSGTTLQQYACNGTSAQSYELVANGATYGIVSTASSLCLDASRGDGVLQQVSCNGAATQQFTFTVATASTTTAPSPPASNPPGPTSTVQIGAGHDKGMAVGLYYLSPTQLAAAVADLKSLGVTWVRMEFPWNLIQPNDAGDYDLAAWDGVVQALDGAGIQLLGLIDYTPAWARAAGTNQFYPPTNVADFGTYAAFLASRYAGQGVHAWEIWNEENGSTFFQPAPSPTTYVSLLASAYTAIKGVDPTALVMLGGMATLGDDGINQNAVTFLANVYAAGGAQYFDAVAFHPYTYPELPATSIYNNWGQMYASSPSLRSVMTDNGDAAKKIWMTEFGYPTFPEGAPALTEAGQAAYLQQAYQLQATFDWAGPLFWYTYADAASPNPANPEDYFGLVRSDGSQKPAYAVYESLPQ